MNRTLIETADGSLTLFVPALNEHYHSTHGALQEANHVFIQNGVACKNHLDSIRILEMGLGTGINAFLTMAWAKSYLGMVTYVGIEAFPVEEFLIDSCLQAVGVRIRWNVVFSAKRATVGLRSWVILGSFLALPNGRKSIIPMNLMWFFTMPSVPVLKRRCGAWRIWNAHTMRLAQEDCLPPIALKVRLKETLKP